MKKFRSILPLCLLATIALVGCDNKETPKKNDNPTQESQDNGGTNSGTEDNSSGESGGNNTGNDDNGGTVTHEHTWGNPTYTWREDYTSCTAERVCTADSTHKETETKNSTYTVTTAPTEEDGGAGRYTVNFENTAFTTQTYDVRLAPLPHTHVLSKVDAVESTFFYQGNVEYYRCAGCGKNFDANNKELTDVSLPLLDTDLSLGVNGTAVGDFTRTDKPNNYIEWKISDVSLNKDDVITVMPKGSTDKTFSYHPDTNSNITEERKVHNDVDNGEVTIEGNPNGLYLSVSGFKYDGIVIKINNNVYPMNNVTYFESSKQTYIYGYAYLNPNDVVAVIDNDTNTVYDFDDLDDDTTWNTYDFHKGINDEIVIDYQARYGFEFDRGGNKKISITKAFAPNNTSSVSVNYNSGRIGENLTDNEIEQGTEIYTGTMWYITHECTINKDDVVSYIENNGLHIFTQTISLDANEEFNLKDNTNDSIIASDHLVSLDVEEPSAKFVIDGSYIKALKKVDISIVYTPALNDIHIYEQTGVGPISTGPWMYSKGSILPMTVDSNNVALYENYTSEKNYYIAFMDASNNYLEVTLDPSIDSSIWHVIGPSGLSMVYFDKVGTFNIKLDLTTKVLSLDIISIEEDVPYVPTELTGGSIYFSKYGNKRLTVNPNNSNELCLLDMTISDNTGYFCIYDSNRNSVTASIASDSQTYITNSSILYYVTQTGTYNFYINKNTLILRVEKIA
ncbi:MAG: hypothetical protein J6T15_04075 [Bacilli bacterium]|nr:hypothetical protein [Bacilli bacterium]